jgi:CheY-like chemotaxis protein
VNGQFKETASSKLLTMTAFHVLLIAFVVSVSAKLPALADNAEARSSVSEVYVESSVVNDNICNNHEKKVAFDVILFDNNSPMQRTSESGRINKRQATRDYRREYKDRPRPDQRSLLIVFDATGSMHDDLEQLRAGAKEIVNELSSREDNPIYNYVLVVYRDPGEYSRRVLSAQSMCCC